MKGYWGELAMMFGVSLGLTIIVELAVVFVFLCITSFKTCRGKLSWQNGQNKKPFVRFTGLLVVLVNLLTNPPAVLLCWLGSIYLPFSARFPLQLTVEALVIAAEGYIYRSYARLPRWRIPGPIVLSAAANLCSWLVGRII